MSLMFPHMTEDEICTDYNALGLLWLVPVYAHIEYDTKQEVYFINHRVVEANWVPKPLFWAALGLTSVVVHVLGMLGKEPTLPILILKTWGDILDND